jgi:hypothetical protein
MNRLIEKMVFSGFVTAWRFATWPTSLSPCFVNATDRRRRASALRVGDHRGGVALHDGDHRVGRPQIDADDLAQEKSSP